MDHLNTIRFPERSPQLAAVCCVAIAAAWFNIQGAWGWWDDKDRFALAFAVLGCELVALFGMSSIIEDWSRRCFVKAIMGAALWLFACTASVFFGHAYLAGKAAMDTAQLAMAADAMASLPAQIAAAQSKVATLTDAIDLREARLHLSGLEQRLAEAQLAQASITPMVKWQIVSLIILWECLKALGKWTLAEPAIKRAKPRKAAKRAARKPRLVAVK